MIKIIETKSFTKRQNIRAMFNSNLRIFLTLLIFITSALIHGCKKSYSACPESEPPESQVKNNATKTDSPTLALLPLGNVPEEALNTVKLSINNIYGWKVKVIKKAPLPGFAWYKPGKRYRAEKILSLLLTKIPDDAEKIMGIITKDISTTKPPYKDWGICGLAEISGSASIISTYRIKRKLGKIPPEKRHKKYLSRLYALAAHEFGHQLGLSHCLTRGCIMEDAGGTVLTFDRGSGQLCKKCLRLLHKNHPEYFPPVGLILPIKVDTEHPQECFSKYLSHLQAVQRY